MKYSSTVPGGAWQMEQTKQYRHFWVSGRVQGVAYRASTQQQARHLGLTGWVRNLHDGRVELLACGDLEQLEHLQSWLWQGPEFAQVDSIEVVEETCQEPQTGFEIL